MVVYGGPQTAWLFSIIGTTFADAVFATLMVPAVKEMAHAEAVNAIVMRESIRHPQEDRFLRSAPSAERRSPEYYSSECYLGEAPSFYDSVGLVALRSTGFAVVDRPRATDSSTP